MGVNDSRGSIWRKWDLHVHTPETKLSGNFNSWDTFLETIEKSDLSVIGVTDYFSIDNYKKVLKYKEQGRLQNIKLILPNIEFRITDRNKDDEHINIHLIFSPDIEIERIEDFLNRLPLFNTSSDNRRLYCKDRDLREVGYNRAIISLDELVDILKINFNREEYLLSAPCRGYGSFRPDRDGRGGEIALKIEDYIDFVFGNNSDRDFFLKENRYPRKTFRKKGVFLGSDAHKEEEIGGKFTWVKADTTFLGLLQALKNPEERILIGEPPIFKRLEEEPSKFINKLIITNIDSYDGSKGKWFDNVEIDFNPGFVAIIGNKGNGKSALADTLGLCGNSKNYRYFAFLRKERFCDPKSKLADKFIATLIWENDKKIEKKLNEQPDFNKPELVRYLPQNYFELLTADLDGHKKFESKIKEIIFQYIPEEKKYQMGDLDELIRFLSENTEGKIIPLVRQLEKINKEIVELESKRDPDYEQSLINEKKKREEEISDLREAEKKKREILEKISASLKHKASKLRKIEELDKREKEFIKNGKSLKEKYSEIEKNMAELKEFIEWIENIKQSFEYELEEKEELAKKFSLNLNEILKLKINLAIVEDKIKNFQREKEKLKEEIGNIRENIEAIRKEKENLSRSLEKDESIYQKTLSEISEIEGKINKLIGNETEYKTLKWIEKEIKFINEGLKQKLKSLKKEQIELSIRIYELLENLIGVYKDLKKYVDKELKDYIDKLRSLNYNLEIDARLEISNKEKFIENIITFFDKRTTGYFRSDNSKDTYDKLREMIDEIDFNNKEDMKNFLLKFIEKLEENNNFPIKQIKGRSREEKKENLLRFYNFLFSINRYLKPTYILKLGEKPLEVLSPGEKGAILLIFYLMLDKDNIPLIIDQPEENLDNESIFKILVDFIREVKHRRQLILITHNPNLAVASDADQIIHVKIDRQDSNKVKVISGSLENPKINKVVTDVLEGTLKAFKIRDERYIKDGIGYF